MVGRVAMLGGLRIFREGERLVELPGQPKRCALLVSLAADAEESREVLMGRLWPDRDPARARHALNQTVYELRRTLGEGWVDVAADTLRIGDDVLADVREFESCMSTGDPVVALRHYRGDFLQGIYLANTKEFELWVDGRRSRLRRQHRKARREALQELLSHGAKEEALATARDWAEIEPFEDEAQLRFVELMAQLGLRAEALEHFEAYRRRLAAEEGQLEPLDELVQLVRRIRSGNGPALPGAFASAAAAPAPPGHAGTETTAEPVDEIEPATLAVLPFANMSPEPGSDYFADGMTEELIAVLNDLSGVHVAARTSSFAFKHSPLDIREIGRRLDVDWLVEGSVRKAGNHIRIATRLIKTADGMPFWSGRYDRDLEDVFLIQEEISRAIAEALSITLSESVEILVRRRTEKPDAYQNYLLGRYHWNRRTPDALEEAVRSFEEAIRTDPDYVPAWAGLADAYMAQAQFAYRRPSDVLPLASAACDRAYAINPATAETRLTRAHLYEILHLDFVAADREYQHAIALNPRDGTARAWYAALLIALGRLDDALHQMRIGVQLEPFSLPMRFSNGMLLYRAREYRLALAELKTAAEMSPSYYAPPCFASLTLTCLGAPAEAVALSREAISRLGPVPALLMSLGHALGALGKQDEARQVVVQMNEIGKKFYVPAVLRMVVYAAIGDADAAFHDLDLACEERYGQVMFINVDPVFDPIRYDPRFETVAKRLNLA